MNGRQVYTFAVRVLCDTVKVLLENNGLNVEEIKYIIPHQANLRIIEAASKRLNIPLEKFYVNIDEYANTSAASIPIAMDEMNRKGLLERGDKLLTIGFGGGLTYGGNYLIW
jgi:3-oxoacyl-[acyl-carrier-protein] synthase-3